jgi:hypothetical protein
MLTDESPTQRLTPPGNRTWRLAGVLVTVVALLVGGFFIVRTLFGSSAAAEEQQRQSYQRPVTRLEFDVDSGDISVAPAGDGQISVERTLHYRRAKPTSSEEWTGDTLRLASRCPEEKGCWVNWTVRVPAGVAVLASTQAGDVSTVDITGELDLTSTAGDVSVRGSGGAVRVRGEAGNVTGTGLKSTSVDVQTTDGAVSLDFAVPPTTARVVGEAGSIRIAVPRAGTGPDGYTVHASTQAGDRKVTVDEDSAGRHSISAELVDGDVSVGYA